MAQLWYAGVDLSDIQTQNYGFQPVPDIADYARLYVKLVLEVVALVHTNAPGAGMGRTLGASLDDLLHTLTQPRQQLYFRVGNDLVVESPPVLPDGTRLPCDCKNGPFTDARVLQIVNDTSAFVRFKVETYLNDANHFILSNVWGYEGGDSNSLDVHVGHLREKLEAAGKPRLIQTVRSFGYTLQQQT